MVHVEPCLGKLGKDASRPGIQKFVKDTYGLHMTLDHISNCKGELKRKKGPSKTVVTKQSVASDQEPKKPASAPARESESNGISLEDIEAVEERTMRERDIYDATLTINEPAAAPGSRCP